MPIDKKILDLIAVAAAVDYDMQVDLRNIHPNNKNPGRSATVAAAVKQASAAGVNTGDAADMATASEAETEMFTQLLRFLMDSGILPKK